MKVKLLKKVRKRFSIVHYPKGMIWFNQHYDYNIFTLYDSNDSISIRSAQLGRRADGRKWCNDIFNTEKECINHLKNKIIEILISEGHKNKKTKNIINSSKKVWWLP